MQTSTTQRRRAKKPIEDSSPLNERVDIPKPDRKVVINCLAVCDYIDERANQDRCTRLLNKAVIDFECKGVWASTDAVNALRTLTHCTINEELFEYLYTLNTGTRCCMSSEWNNIYNRCRKCFRPNHQGNCEKCFIPTKIYNLTEEAWRKKRCIICHAEKKYVNALLCGGVFCILCQSRSRKNFPYWELRIQLHTISLDTLASYGTE